MIYTLVTMNYLWQEFNIKTFPSETIVFRDGVFQPELSTVRESDFNNPESDIIINKVHDLPIHIIYIGEIDGQHNIKINLSAPEQPVFLTVKIQNKKPAFLNIFVKNTGKNSEFNGNILAQNYSELLVETTGLHMAPDTNIFIKTKVVAHKSTDTKLTGAAIIEPVCKNCKSDIEFSVLADPSAKIMFEPKQLISAAPESAEHSASLYKGTAPQIEYLRTTGMGTLEIKKILEEAFINN